MAKVRDRLWLWGHPAGSHNQQYGLVQQSHITPAVSRLANTSIDKYPKGFRFIFFQILYQVSLEIILTPL